LALMRPPKLGTRRRAERRVPDGHTEPVVAVASAYTPARCARWGSNPQSDGDGLRCPAGQTKTPVASADRGSVSNRKAIAGRLPVIGKDVRSLGIRLCVEHAYAQVIPRAQERCEGQISVWFEVDGHHGTSDSEWREV